MRKKNCRTEPTFAEERKVIAILQRYSDRGNLTRGDLIDTVEILVTTFPAERQNALRFVNGRPGRSFCRGFEKRHRDAICFKKPSPQEAARFRATNADNMTSHFAAIERIIHENDIDAARLANLDESGITPGNYQSRVGKKKVYCTRYATQHKQTAETSSPESGNINRVTLVGVVFASGEAGGPTFIFEGTKLRYRTVSVRVVVSTMKVSLIAFRSAQISRQGKTLRALTNQYSFVGLVDLSGMYNRLRPAEERFYLPTMFIGAT